MVESAILTRGWWKKCCMLPVADHMPWATLGVPFGRIANVMTNSYGDVHMNTPSWAHTYVL